MNPEIFNICYYYSRNDNNFFSCHWSVTNRCNYMCDYCDFPSKTEDFFPYEHTTEIINFLNKLFNKYNLSLMLFGGEPLLHPDIIKIVDKLETSIYPLNIFTNLSSDISTIKELCSLRKDICFYTSFHYSKSNIKEFRKKLDLIKEMDNDICLKIIWDSRRKEEIKDIYNSLSEYEPLISLVKHMTQSFTKNDEQWVLEKNSDTKDCSICYVNGRKMEYEEVRNILNDKETFKGYLCSAGKNHIHISSNGDVNYCVTKFRDRNQPLFNIITNNVEEIMFNDDEIVCDEVNCYSEIGVKKQKEESLQFIINENISTALETFDLYILCSIIKELKNNVILTVGNQDLGILYTLSKNSIINTTIYVIDLKSKENQHLEFLNLKNKYEIHNLILLDYTKNERWNRKKASLLFVNLQNDFNSIIQTLTVYKDACIDEPIICGTGYSKNTPAVINAVNFFAEEFNFKVNVYNYSSIWRLRK